MPEVEVSRTEQEGQKVRHGFLVDLSSKIKFDPDKFDAEIKKIDPPVTLPINEMYQAKFVVIGDKMVLFSVHNNHIEGIEWIKKVFPDVDLNGEIKSAGHITVNIRQAWMSVKKEVERIISGMSTGLLQNGTLRLDKSEGYKQTVLKEKLGDYFSIEK
jgi:hypothetical protein